MTTRILALSFALLSATLAADWSDYYDFEDIPNPPGVNNQIGGILALKDGHVAACYYSGEVYFYNPAKKSWSLFAQGLHCPLGLLEDQDGSLLVMQWAELTRLSDTDKDGVADHYQTICDDFGLTGNYHEFAYGPARDAEGNLYVALNVASNGAGIFKNVRGPFTTNGLARELMDKRPGNDWKKVKKEAGRMYSRVPYRGCILKITPDGKASPFAYGFRSPDGIGFDDQGRLWVTDNQGDWRGVSPLYHVTEGNFYGHPASLTWKKNWTRNPLDVPVEELESLRTRAAGLFPYGDLANSPTQPIPTIDPEKFGLPKSEILIGDMNQPVLTRFIAEEVNGSTQGVMIPFLFSMDLGIGNHRFTFDKDGAMYVGKTHIKWAGGEGIKKVTWKKKPFFIVENVSLKKDGFVVSFNHPLGDKTPTFEISRNTYNYGPEYGSPKVDEKSVEPTGITVSNDRKSLKITLPQIDEHRLYTIEVKNAADTSGLPLMGDKLYYTVVKKR